MFVYVYVYVYVYNVVEVTKDCYLATLDVSSLYTNIDIEDGLSTVLTELQKHGQHKPSAETVTYFLVSTKVRKCLNWTILHLTMQTTYK